MAEKDKPTGNLNLETGGDTNVGGDVVGGNKIITNLFGGNATVAIVAIAAMFFIAIVVVVIFLQGGGWPPEPTATLSASATIAPTFTIAPPTPTPTLTATPPPTETPVPPTPPVIIVPNLFIEMHRRSLTSRALAIAWSPDNSYLAIGTLNGRLQIWLAGSDNPLRTLPPAHTESIRSVAWKPQADILATGSADFTVRLWLVASGQSLTDAKQLENTVHAVAWSANGEYLAAVSQAGEVFIWDKAGNTLAFTSLPTSLHSVAWSSDGQSLAVGGSTGKVFILTPQLAVAHELLTGYNSSRALVLGLGWSADGQWLAVGVSSGSLQVFEAANFAKPPKTLVISSNGGLRNLSWCSVASLVAFGNADGTVQVWDVLQSAEAVTIGQHAAQSQVAWSPNCHWLASFGDDTDVRLWGQP